MRRNHKSIKAGRGSDKSRRLQLIARRWYIGCRSKYRVRSWIWCWKSPALIRVSHPEVSLRMRNIRMLERSRWKRSVLAAMNRLAKIYSGLIGVHNCRWWEERRFHVCPQLTFFGMWHNQNRASEKWTEYTEIWNRLQICSTALRPCCCCWRVVDHWWHPFGLMHGNYHVVS